MYAQPSTLHRSSRRFLGRVVVLAVAALSVVVPVAASSQVADAAGNCGGTLTWRRAIRVAGDGEVGELAVYYNSANGNNCARFNRLGAARGTATHTVVQIVRCEGVNPCYSTDEPGTGERSDGRFAYYAGPVRVHSPNDCVAAIGGLTWRGEYREISTGQIGC